MNKANQSMNDYIKIVDNLEQKNEELREESDRIMGLKHLYFQREHNGRKVIKELQRKLEAAERVLACITEYGDTLTGEDASEMHDMATDALKEMIRGEK